MVFAVQMVSAQCNTGSLSFPINHRTEFVCSLLFPPTGGSCTAQLGRLGPLQLAKGEQCPGHGSTGKAPLTPPFHAGVPDLTPWHGEVPPALGDAQCPPGCVRGTHASLFSMAPKLTESHFLSEKNTTDFPTSGQIFHQI